MHELAAADQLRLTYKAAREVLILGLTLEDVRDVIGCLNAEDLAGRLTSKMTSEWMYVFKPDVGGQILYVKVVLREHCLVVSFHEDEGTDHEEDE
jgi:MqsR (Motility quorum-sensing regulator) toxin of toxin-antitoxin system